MKTLMNQKCRILLIFFICLSFLNAACSSDEKEEESTKSNLPGITANSPELSESEWRLTQVDCPGNITIDLEYDSNGYFTGATVIGTGQEEYFEFEYNTDNLLSDIFIQMWDDGPETITVTFEYQEGKIWKVHEIEGDGDDFSVEVTEWNGYSPIQASVSIIEDGKDYNGTMTFSFDSDGRLIQEDLNITDFYGYSGVVNRSAYSYVDYTVTITEYEFEEGNNLVHTETEILTFDSGNRLTNFEESGYEGNEIEKRKTSTFAYDENGNIEEMTVTRQGYENGAPSGQPEYSIYTFNYSQANSIPTPNDIVGVNYSNLIGWAPSFVNWDHIDEFDEH